MEGDPRRRACSKEDPAWISRRARQAAGGMGDIWTDLGKALVRQAATQASIDAVVVKAAEERNAAKRMAAEERNAAKRMAAEEKRMTAAAKRQAGAPAAKRQAGVKCEHGR